MSTSPVLTPVAETAIPVRRPRPSWEEITAWCVIGAGLLFVMFRHLVGGLVGGLALFLILDWLAMRFQRRMSGSAARPLALLLVALIVGGMAIGGIALTISFARHHADNIPAMMTKMADILESTRAWLGGYGEDLIPEVMTDAENMKAAIAGWLKEHAAVLKVAGGTFSVGLVHLIMGALLAIMVFFRHVTRHGEPRGPLAAALADKVRRFAHAFGRIATAQIKISAVNTALTALYILVILPLFGKHIPFAGTIVLVTFICGLIPVLGNLISNTVITVLSLGVSVGTAVASLVFLIVIHKLEYLINSRIVGSETDSQAWEILLAILIGETAFGVGGVVMAPIVYAFLKRELRERGLV
ncbi:MAG TPA: AI-2E family transporter [Thermoanaerobaculia bacterium]|jgi:predicted PurR-regulated permease PerM|nr:AI-2E family transporter [Thermoanaerobaculia bacterium]